MTLLTRLGRLAAATALVLAVTAPAPAPAQELHDLARHIAEQSAALNQVLDRLSRPEIARAVVDSALEGDARTFEGIFEGVEVKVPNKCVWIADTVEKLTSKFTGFEEQCRVKDNLTHDEWILYVIITMRHHSPVAANEDDPATLNLVGSDPVIPPGPYLDELKAHGLVHCPLVPTYHSGISLFPGKPERFCFQKP